MSRGSVVPDLVSALVSAARSALPNVTVQHSWPAELQPGDYLMVSTKGSGESSSVTRSGVDDEGDIECLIATSRGARDPQDACDDAWAIKGVIDGLVRSRSAVVVSGTDAQLFTMSKYSWEAAQTERGAEYLLTFYIHYKARI